jgi:hypothetical protein
VGRFASTLPPMVDVGAGLVIVTTVPRLVQAPAPATVRDRPRVAGA